MTPYQPQRSFKPAITPEYIESTLSTDIIFRWLHIPFVVAEIVWDYIDTSNIIAAQMRLSQFKKTTRRIKELRSEYLHTRQPLIKGSYQQIEQDNSEALLDEIDSDVSKLYQDIFKTVKEKYPSLDKDYQIFLAATCEAYVVYRAILQYNVDFRAFLLEKYNLHTKEVLTRSFLDLKSCFESYLTGYTEFLNNPVIINSITTIKTLISDIVLFDDSGQIPSDFNLNKNN